MQTVIKNFLDDLGIDLSKWELETDDPYDMYRSSEDEHREVIYRSKVNGEYTMYFIMQYFRGQEWELIEFQIAGD